MNAPQSLRRFQAGFSLVTAIFLLVILAALGAFMVTISTSQQMSSAMDLQGSRAYRAARSGAEWAAATLCNGSPCTNPLTACFAPTDMATDGFNVHVTCTMNSYAEAGTTAITVAGAAWAGGTATLTTTANHDHGLGVNQTVTVTAVAPAGFNGTDLTVTAVPAANQLSYAVAIDPGAYVAGGNVFPPRYLFWIESTASAGGAAGNLTYIERTVNSLIGF